MRPKALRVAPGQYLSISKIEYIQVLTPLSDGRVLVDIFTENKMGGSYNVDADALQSFIDSLSAINLVDPAKAPKEELKADDETKT
jgi:hypothetical protein